MALNAEAKALAISRTGSTAGDAYITRPAPWHRLDALSLRV